MKTLNLLGEEMALQVLMEEARKQAWAYAKVVAKGMVQEE